MKSMIGVSIKIKSCLPQACFFMLLQKQTYIYSSLVYYNIKTLQEILTMGQKKLAPTRLMQPTQKAARLIMLVMQN